MMEDGCRLGGRGRERSKNHLRDPMRVLGFSTYHRFIE